MGWALLSPIPPLLPAGISFYTFQTLSYTLDVYWNEQEPERHFGRFATFVSFFPHLVAGPIMRAGALIPQLPQFSPVRVPASHRLAPSWLVGACSKKW